MNVRDSLNLLSSWPALKQLRGGNLAGLGRTAYSNWTESLSARTEAADRVVKSVCSAPPRKYGGIQAPLHPRSRRFSSLTYLPGTQRSSRLANRGAVTLSERTVFPVRSTWSRRTSRQGLQSWIPQPRQREDNPKSEPAVNKE